MIVLAIIFNENLTYMPFQKRGCMDIIKLIVKTEPEVQLWTLALTVLE